MKMNFKFKSKAAAAFKDDAKKGGHKKLKKTLLILGVLVLLVGGVIFWKAGALFNKMSLKGNVLGSIGKMIPGVADGLEGESEGRVNVLLLGMRGADDPAGGNLADSIMVVSLGLKDNKISMISIPRDLWVKDIQQDSFSKINAIYAQGEAAGKGQGMKDMEQKVSEISGLKVSYGMMINHQGFKDLINALGGVEINLSQPFQESVQFNQEGVCDGVVFTVPTGNWQNKIVKSHKTLANGQSVEVKRKVPMYPLCLNKNPECGGDFKLPAGQQTINGDQALCFARSRDQSSDFDRAKRQQMILQAIKSKALSVGTLTDFEKINGMIDSLGNNVQTDMELWQVKKLYSLEQGLKDPQIIQRVLENSEEGLLYAPEPTKETGYILLPRGDNYDKIKELFANIFSLSSQSDINKISR